MENLMKNIFKFLAISLLLCPLFSSTMEPEIYPLTVNYSSDEDSFYSLSFSDDSEDSSDKTYADVKTQQQTDLHIAQLERQNELDRITFAIVMKNVGEQIAQLNENNKKKNDIKSELKKSSKIYQPKSKEGSFITQVINNTGTAINLLADTINKSELLISEPAEKKADMNTSRNYITIPPHSKHTLHNLKIPSMAVDDPEKNISCFEKKGMRIFIKKITASASLGNDHLEESKPILIMRQKGDLLSLISYCGAIKSFNFLEETHPKNPKNNTGTDIIIGTYLPDNSTYTLEINELQAPTQVSKRRAQFFAYNKGSLEINFKENEIDSSTIKANLDNHYPIAQIISFNNDKTPITALIEFDKVVTESFMNKFCEYIKNSDLGKVIALSAGIKDKKSLINFVIYREVTREDLQEIIDHVNELDFPQYDQ